MHDGSLYGSMAPLDSMYKSAGKQQFFSFIGRLFHIAGPNTAELWLNIELCNTDWYILHL